MTETLPLLLSNPDCRTAERIALALAIKGLDFATAPLAEVMLPAELKATGCPLLIVGQGGACGWVAALDLLEEAKPEPSLFPNGNRGMPIALSFWSDHAAERIKGGADPGPFANLIERQIGDGRPYLQGTAPGLADIESYIAVLGVSGQNLPASVSAWRKRMKDLKNSVSARPEDPNKTTKRLQETGTLDLNPIDLDRLKNAGENPGA